MKTVFKNPSRPQFSTLPIGATFKRSQEDSSLLMKTIEVTRHIDFQPHVSYNTIVLNTGCLTHTRDEYEVIPVTGSWVEE